MKISCICLTYGRTALLNEALESFLRQDYQDKELVIFNSYAKQRLVFDHPQVKVVNSAYRPKTLGETRNLCIAYSTGDFLLTWDDDDIYLPHYISWLVKNRGDGHWVKQCSKFSLKGDKVQKLSGQANNQFLFSREAFNYLLGYPEMDSGEDVTFYGRMKAAFLGRVVPCKPEEVGFIYRFGGGAYNLSACGRSKPGQPSGLKKCADKLAKRGVTHGRIQLAPHWSRDYVQITRDWIKANT